MVRRSGTAVGLVIVALGLAGCAVGPDWLAPTADVPARWHASADGRTAALGEWWRDLGDPLLDELIEKAVAGNLDVATARAKIREARALARQAGAALLPSLDASGSATRAQSKSTTTGDTRVSDLFRAGFDATWEIDLFGANARTTEAASANLAASEADLDAALLTLVGDVASTYVEVRSGRARIALAKRTAASQRKTAALTRTKFDAGSASAVDTAKAEAAAASTEAGIPSLETAVAEAVHRLSILTGREPGALADRLRRDGAIPLPRRALPAGVPAAVIALRPDVRAAEQRLAQATAKLGASEAALWPSISLSGSISTSASKIGDLSKASSIAWSWGPSISIPIFEGGRLTAARDAQAAVRDQSFVAWRASVLTALGDVENALVALAGEKRRSAKLADAVASYRRAATLSRSLYESGTASFLDVLDAERSLYSAEDTLIQSRAAIATDHVALAKALGGGWRRPVDTVKPEVVDEATGPRLALPAVLR
jgi:NodT family efflux transporter outer membrane factor (OMF) lipoprotein